MERVSRRHALKLAAAGVGGAMLADASRAMAAGDNVVNITYDWTYNGPPGKVAQYWQAVQSKLGQEDHGVRIGQLGETTFENLYASVDAQIQAKSGSDVATWYGDYHTFREAYLGAISPVDKLVGSSKPHLITNDSCTFHGQYWGVPLVLEIAVLAVNRRLLEKAKVQVGDRFESYEAFIEACNRLKSAGIRPLQAGTSDGFNAEKWLYFLQFQVCDNVTDFLGGMLGTLPMEAPFFAFPRKELQRLVANYMNPKPQSDTEEMATGQFLAGNAAMMMNYLSPIVDPGTPTEFDIVGLPAANVKFNRPVIGCGDNLVIMSYSRQQEAAGRLLRFISEPAQANLWWELNRTLPASDQLDTSKLPGPAKRVWDMVLADRSKAFGLWWPGNLPPSSLFTFQYGVTQNLFAGATDDEARKQSEQIFTSWRQQHPDEVDVLKAYELAVAEVGGVSPS